MSVAAICDGAPPDLEDPLSLDVSVKVTSIKIVLSLRLRYTVGEFLGS
jgi:hypothetical protein